jgi:DNA-binding CsgD family transcriptional regulator/PAS domain-containing protein
MDMLSEQSMWTDAGAAGLLRSIYDAALDASRWQEFLVRFATEFSSQAAMIFGQDFSDRSVEVTGAPASLAAHHGITEEFMRSFSAHYCSTNVWTEDERFHHEGLLINGSKVYSDKRLPRTEWHADWLRPQDLFYILAAVVEKRAHRSFNVTAVRSKRCGPYTEQEEARLQALVPHLQTAFALHRRLHRAEVLAHASVAVLEHLPMGVVLLDERASVLHANERAHALAQQTGLLRFDREALRACNHGDDVRLQRAMLSVVVSGRGVPLNAGGAFRLQGLVGLLHVLVTPLPHWSTPFGEQTAGAVFISDPASVAPPLAGMLRIFYRLTPAEARLAEALVNGLSPQEYAERHGLSIHTVRSQLKAAAAKVGVSRQADLVRTILTGPAMLSPGHAYVAAG